ncbi:Fc.00g029650.m01.CDS01 [Cosmosporella sp. VM-42]
MSLVQKSIRVRTRNLTKAPDDKLVSSPPSATSQGWDSPVSTYHSEAHLSSISFQSLEVDPNENVHFELYADELKPNSSRTLSNASTSLSDFSHYLPSRTQSCDDMEGIPTTLDTKECCFVSHKDDYYGWDAELDRRSKFGPCPMEKCKNGCETVSLRYLRANGSKNSLLQRVFNVGSTSSLGKYD